MDGNDNLTNTVSDVKQEKEGQCPFFVDNVRDLFYVPCAGERRMKKNSAYAPPHWNFVGHWLVGTCWQVNGSKQNTYSVTITERGFVCDCTGFVFHGKCKHTKSIAEKFDD